MSRGGSLGRVTADQDRVVAWTIRNVERLIEALDAYQLFCAQVGLSLQYKAGGGADGKATLPGATAAFEVLAPALRRLLDEIWHTGSRVSYMHVLAFQLQRRDVYQGSLLDEPDPRRQQLAEVKRRVNAKIGRFALRSAATLPLADVYADAAHAYDISDVQGKICF